MTARGRFIVLEGIDGAGTTTQAERLGRWFDARGLEHVVTREPSTGPVGSLLRSLLRGEHAPVDRETLALLFAADRIDHLHREIQPALARGAHVVSDRYVLSSLAYQSIDVDADFVARINARAPAPDLTIFVDVPARVAARRRSERGGPDELFDALETQERVVDGYRREIERLSATGAAVVTIDGELSIEEVARAVTDAAESCLATAPGAT